MEHHEPIFENSRPRHIALGTYLSHYDYRKIAIDLGYTLKNNPMKLRYTQAEFTIHLHHEEKNK